MSRTSIIANPTAGRGRAKRLLDMIAKTFAFVRASDFLLTTMPGEEAALTRRTLDRGSDTIVVCGGDGTCSRVAEAIMHSGRACRLGVVPCGTGNDFAKTLGVGSYSLPQIAKLVEDGDSRLIDIGIADGHHFLNSCGFGFDASVLEATQHVRFLQGDLVYVYSALWQLFTYPGVDVSVGRKPDDKPRRLLMLTVSNGQFLGGAFRIAPAASVVDGELDVGIFSACNTLERLRIFSKAFRGTHLGLRFVTTERMRALTLHFPEPPAMEIDGELRRAASSTVEIECRARTLAVIAAPGALV